MASPQQLLGMLADGQLHSGSELAGRLGITRSAVWKHIGQLEALEIEVEAQVGKGYRLKQPLELLDSAQLSAELSAAAKAVCGLPELLWSSPSTSSELLARAAPRPGEAHVCLAEYQSAGRGRRGRQWFAPAGYGICMSLAWQFVSSPENLSCLGLAAGVGVLRAVRRAGVSSAQLKWPNDVVLAGSKLAGILIDVQGEAGGPLHVVVGVGVNYRVSEAARAAISADGGLRPAALCDFGGPVAGRNATAIYLIEELLSVLQKFTSMGFHGLVDDWKSADYLAGRSLNIVTDSGNLTGVARGISADGRLRVEIDGRIELLATGDVRVRPVAPGGGE